MSILLISSIPQIAYIIEKFSHDNIDILWIIFKLSSLFFAILLVWFIIAMTSKRQEIRVSSDIAQLKPIITTTDPFVKSDISTFTDEMGYKVISSEEITSSKSNYLITSSPGEDELDLLQSEIKMYEDSLLQEKDFGMQKDFIPDDTSDNIYSAPSPAPECDYSSDFNQYNEENLSSGLSSSVKSVDLPPMEYSRKNKMDIPIPEKPSRSSSIDISRKSESKDALKIELPRKDMVSNKEKKVDLSRSFSELSRDRTAPLKAMRIELPQKGKFTEPKKESPPLENKGGRIELPRKMSN